MLREILFTILGFACGGGGVAFINHLFGRRRERADVAKTLADTAMAMGELNLTLNREMANLKKVVAILTDAIDEILPHIQGLSPDQLKRLKDANTTAKLAI